MTADLRSPPDKKSGAFTPGPAIDACISLSQAILAPLDALAKSQVHAARSFLNLVLQIAYPHLPLDKDGKPIQTDKEENLYYQNFKIQNPDNPESGISISIPTLALVPVQPLVIDNAKYTVELSVENIQHHTQIQKSEEKTLRQELGAAQAGTQTGTDDPPHAPRPWYLVSEPISVRGTLSPTDSGSQKKASIKMEINVSAAPTPAGLAKLLTMMTQQPNPVSHNP